MYFFLFISLSLPLFCYPLLLNLFSFAGEVCRILTNSQQTPKSCRSRNKLTCTSVVNKTVPILNLLFRKTQESWLERTALFIAIRSDNWLLNLHSENFSTISVPILYSQVSFILTQSKGYQITWLKLRKGTGFLGLKYSYLEIRWCA